MDDSRTTPGEALARLLQRHLLALLLLAYGLAAVYPAPGLWVKDARPLAWVVRHAGSPALPCLLLAFLLFHAGLRVRGDRLRRVARRPALLLVGLGANLAVPVAYLLMIEPLLRAWHNPAESATVLVGLAVVAAMPVAGSSTAWSQGTGGDVALSLGLVLASTVLSPLTTPLALELLAAAAPTGCGEELRRLAGRGAGSFLAAWVLVPSLAGMALRPALGLRRVARAEEVLKPLAPLVLLVLCYSNASACLPRAFATPDWDFLAVTFVCVLGLCALTFSCGHLLGRVLGAGPDQRSALTFGLGMSNNGTGQVLASAALASQPLVLLPMIAYNVTQHLAAGCAHALLRRRAGS
jgi:BASS family bile acid:Na+ symporter